MPTWMNRSKEHEAARIAAARARRQEAGNCIRCGLRAAASSKQLCESHLEEQRQYQLARYHAGKRDGVLTAVDYSIACRCGHRGENHKAMMVDDALVRMACLLCECRSYKPNPS